MQHEHEKVVWKRFCKKHSIIDGLQCPKYPLETVLKEKIDAPF